MKTKISLGLIVIQLCLMAFLIMLGGCDLPDPGGNTDPTAEVTPVPGDTTAPFATPEVTAEAAGTPIPGTPVPGDLPTPFAVTPMVTSVPTPVATLVPESTPDLSYVNNWLHFGYDSCYTAYNPDETTITTSNITQLTKRWDIGGGDGYFRVISRAPAIYHGMFYTSGAGDNLTAYGAKGGEYLWSFGSGNTGWAPQPVVSEDGIVFYLESGGSGMLYDLFAVNAVTGAQIWQSQISFDLGFNETAIVTVDESRGLVYLVENSFAMGGGFYALSKADGTIAWYMSEAKDDVAFSGDYALLSGNRIFVKGEKDDGYRVHSVYCIDADTHEITDSYSSPVSAAGFHGDVSSILYYNGTLLVEYCDRDDVFKGKSTLYAYTVATHTELWHKTYSTPITGKPACDIVNNIVFIPTDPYLYAYDGSSGDAEWTYTGFKAIFNPSVANGIVYFISDNNMYALNEDTGAKIFSYNFGYEGNETTQVAINDGMLFFSGNGSSDGDFFALGF